jgi:regulator of sigma E protease
VKFLGDRDPASAGATGALPTDIAPERTFHGASVLRRIAIVAAGPAANFLLAIAVFAVGLMVTGRTVIVPRIDAVQPGSPAQMVGVRPGDVVLAVDGRRIESFDDLQRAVAASFGAPLTVTVARGTERLNLTATPVMREIDDGLGGKARQAVLGVRRSDAAADIKVVPVGPVDALTQGVAKTWYIVAQTGRFVANIVVHRSGADQLGGPIRIAELSGKVAAIGIGPLIELMAILSVSVGLINLLPIPVLDGGHLLFFGIELARGRPVPAPVQRWGMLTGVSAVLALMVFTTFNDVLRLLHS